MCSRPLTKCHAFVVILSLDCDLVLLSNAVTLDFPHAYQNIYKSPIDSDSFLPPNFTVAWRQVMGFLSALMTSA